MKNLASDSKRASTGWRVQLYAACMAIAMLFCCSGAMAQSGAGSIQGTVTDSTGAVIPAASIRVVNTATGVVSTTKSNSAGFYQVPGLFAGQYTVTATAVGMKTAKTSIELLVAQNAVINIPLSAGAVTQQVVVSGADMQLTTTDDGTISTTLENARINQLPMNGRDLATLVGMATPGMGPGGNFQQSEFNGLMPEALEYDVDGTTTQSAVWGGIANYSQQQLIDPDAVQEVRMETSNSGAQNASPATVVVSTKSGTNSLHGTLFETARNNALGIAKNRQDPSNYSAPQYVRNEFGASVGGPIVLPHLYHGKDKSFFFFAYERYSLAESTAVLGTVPTVAMSQGDFSGLVNASGVLQTLYDPSTTANAAPCAATGAANAYCRTPFPNNQIPTGEEGPIAKLYYALAPLPTNASNPLVASNLTSLSPQFVVEPQMTIRLDHVFDENNRAYLHYTQNLNDTDITGGPRNRAADGIPVGGAVSKNGYQNYPIGNFLASVDYTHVFSPTFFAETLVSQQWLNEQEKPGVDPNVDWQSQLALPNNFGRAGFPLIGSGSLIFPLGSDQTNVAAASQITSTIDENLTKTVGRHQMQFGGRYRHERISDLPNQTADTIATSNLATALYNTSSGANYTAVTNTGNADGSFFLGSVASYTIYRYLGRYHSHTMEFDGYFQDNYHVSRKLTVNLGLRYEAHPAVWVKNNLFSSFDLKNDAEVLSASPATLIAEGITTAPIITNLQNIGVKFETAAEAGMPAKLLKDYNLNFLPRVGVAYQPLGGKYGTVIRGAYGRFAYPTRLVDWTSFTNAVPLSTSYAQSYVSAAQAIDGLPNELIRYNDPAQFGVMGNNTANIVNSSSTNSILPGVSMPSISPDCPPEMATEANFTIEQPLKGNSALRASWVWTHASNLMLLDNYNNHPSNYQWEMAKGIVPPTGGASVIGTPQQNTYSATATGPYDQTTWGGNNLHEKTGWSNYNGLQVNYQRLYHHGLAYQISYVFGKELRAGGNDNANTGNTYPIYPDANFPGVLGAVGTMTPAYGAVYAGVAPPPRPTNLPVWEDWHAMDKFQAYQLDNAIPIQHVTFNAIVDLPIGRGKRFLGNANRFVNELVGGFQLAGDGNILSQAFLVSAGNWGATSPLKTYKHKYPITDCRSGVCEKSFLWFNGYLAPTVTQGVAGSTCTKNCVTGLPADYVPMQTPIDNTPGTTYYGDNEVQITAPNINSGKATAIAYDAGPEGGDYLQKKYANGPINYTTDISIFKVFPITERTFLRFNVDAFNALNVQGWNNPGTNGVENNLSSYNIPRQIQLTLRLTF